VSKNPIFTQQGYEALASVLLSTHTDGGDLAMFETRLIQYLGQDNPRFKAGLFERASHPAPVPWARALDLDAVNELGA
jgi:hypothetical protein